MLHDGAAGGSSWMTRGTNRADKVAPAAERQFSFIHLWFLGIPIRAGGGHGRARPGEGEVSGTLEESGGGSEGKPGKGQSTPHRRCRTRDAPGAWSWGPGHGWPVAEAVTVKARAESEAMNRDRTGTTGEYWGNKK